MKTVEFVKQNWKAFIAGSLVMGIPLGLTHYWNQSEIWKDVDRSVTLLVNTIIDLDNIPTTEQPFGTATRTEKMKFVRDYQSTSHPDEWFLFQRQVPFVSQTSDFDRYRVAVEGHRSIARRAHGANSFANVELRNRTNQIIEAINGVVFESPISILAHLRTSSFDEVIPAKDSAELVKLMLVPGNALAGFEGAPTIDLSDPTVIEILRNSGYADVGYQSSLAIPALFELSESAYIVETE